MCLESKTIHRIAFLMKKLVLAGLHNTNWIVKYSWFYTAKAYQEMTSVTALLCKDYMQMFLTILRPRWN